MQLHGAAVKQQADEKRRAERKQRHLQDDLRYALKKLPEPFDITLPYEEVADSSLEILKPNLTCFFLQVVPLIEHLPEFKVVEDDEGRRAAFAKFVKRQKVKAFIIL